MPQCPIAGDATGFICVTRGWSVWIDPMLGGSGHVSDSLIAIVLGPVGAALLVAVVVFSVVKLYASRRRRQQRMEHGMLIGFLDF